MISDPCEAGDKKDALRIKLAELMLKAPNDGGQAAAAVMKDCQYRRSETVRRYL